MSYASKIESELRWISVHRDHIQEQRKEKAARERLGLSTDFTDECILGLEGRVRGHEEQVRVYREMQRPSQEGSNKVKAEWEAKQRLGLRPKVINFEPPTGPAPPTPIKISSLPSGESQFAYVDSSGAVINTRWDPSRKEVKEVKAKEEWEGKTARKLFFIVGGCTVVGWIIMLGLVLGTKYLTQH